MDETTKIGAGIDNALWPAGTTIAPVTTCEKYNTCSSSRLDTIRLPFADMLRLFGEPFRNGGPTGFPDDDFKVDVCWGGVIEIEESIQGNYRIWNYKNGPVYGGAESVEEIGDFSLWYDSDTAKNAIFVACSNAARTPPAPTLRSRALADYEKAEREKAACNAKKQAEEMQRRKETFTRIILKRLGVPGVQATEEDGWTATIDGIRLRAYYSGSTSYNPGEQLHVVGTCPECGEDALSANIFDLADLGAYLANPSYPNHTCPEPEMSATPNIPDDEMPLIVDKLISSCQLALELIDLRGISRTGHYLDDLCTNELIATLVLATGKAPSRPWLKE